MNKNILASLVIGLATAVLIVYAAAAQSQKGVLQSFNNDTLSASSPEGIPLPPQIYIPLVAVTPCSAAPTVISPTTGSLLNTLVPTLYYRRGTASVTYTAIQIADNAAFSPRQEYWTSGGSFGPYSLKLFTNLSPATLYYWRVQDTCGSLISAFSTVYTFTTGSGGVILPAPALTSPISGTLGVTSPLTLTWSSVPGSAGYQVHLREAGGGVSLTQTPLTKYVWFSISANTQYEWWITPFNDYAYGADSAHWWFTTGNFIELLPPSEGGVVVNQGDTSQK